MTDKICASDECEKEHKFNHTHIDNDLYIDHRRQFCSIRCLLLTLVRENV
jgi:hypothetical protein